MSPKLNACFGRIYCQVQNNKCIGKDTTALEEVLEILFLAHQLGCNIECELNCVITKYCSDCV